MNTRESKINKEWIRKLHTGREDLIMETLKELRHSGNSQLLPEIISLLDADLNLTIRDEVISILSDLNNQSSADVLMKNIDKYRGTDYFSALVGSCWQNGLDYSSYMEFFIDIAIRDPYETALEAFTVVEGNVTSLPDKEREKLLQKIDAAKASATIEKAGLLDELIKVVRPLSGPFQYDPS